MRPIDADKLLRDIEKYHVSDGKFQHWVQIQPTIEPDSKETSSTHKALDTISRQDAIDTIDKHIDTFDAIDTNYLCGLRTAMSFLKEMPSAQPEPCEDAVSRNAIIQKLNTMDRYVSEELILCDTDKKFPKNEVFIVDDVYEEIVENLPSVQPERKTAKWIVTTSLQEGQITWRDYKCSNCSHHREKPMNFCEVCGAKMER